MKVGRPKTTLCVSLLFMYMNYQEEYSITLQWVSAYRGIEGNIAAHSLAKKAAVSGLLWSSPPEWQDYIGGINKQCIER